MEQIILMMVL